MVFLQVWYKYGYWKLRVALKDTWNFTYVLPQPPPENNIYKTDIVMLNIIQIIWSKSPAYFCASSETEICIDNEIARTKIVITPEHPLEKHKTAKLSTALKLKSYMLQLVRWIIEVYVNDFIGMKKIHQEHYLCISLGPFSPQYEVFMTPHRSGHKEGYSVAIKYPSLWTILILLR